MNKLEFEQSLKQKLEMHFYAHVAKSHAQNKCRRNKMQNKRKPFLCAHNAKIKLKNYSGAQTTKEHATT
jgi:hypothetical protein